MIKPETLNTKWLQRLVILWGLLMVFGLILAQSNVDSAQIFNLRFNGYAVISLFSALVNCGFAIYVVSKRNEFKSSEVTWYLLFVYTLVFFGLFEMFQRLSATPTGAIFWAALSGIGPAFLGVGLLLFSLQYVKPGVKLNSVIPLLLISGAILYFFFGSGDTIFINSVSATKLYPWGFNNDLGSAFAFDFTWVLGLSAISMGVMARFRKRTQNPILKKQARLFILAISVPVAGAVVFDVLAPVLGVDVPPLAELLTVITAGLMLYGLTHYKLFKVTPASISSDIFSTMTESVIVTDENLQVKLINQAAGKLFKEHNLDNLNTSLIDFFTEEEAKRILSEVAKISNKGDVHNLGNFVYNGNTYLQITAVKTTEEHDIEGFIFAISDVTELQQSYKALESEKQNVEDKVEQRTKQLREAKEKLSELDKIKTEFVILTSHNLRTPLTTIRGNAELLAESKLTKEQHTLVQNLQRSSKRLGGLIEDLLTISEIESGSKKPLLNNMKLHDLINSVAEEAEELAPKNNNKFELVNNSENINLKANATLLKIALHNVIDNAFKFTKDGNIKMTVSNNSDGVAISIKDTGIGIKKKEIPKLFTKFHRGTDTIKYEYEGEGIGLYLAKIIIDEHKGSIRVASEIKKGTEFEISLPVKK